MENAMDRILHRSVPAALVLGAALLLAPPAMAGPLRTAKVPTAMPVWLCMPKMRSQGKRSNSLSSSIASAPPQPSSPGWKMKWTMPSKLRVSARYLAAPSSMVVCPSWPQACITPLVVLR